MMHRAIGISSNDVDNLANTINRARLQCEVFDTTGGFETLNVFCSFFGTRDTNTNAKTFSG
jgi:hypothetical protein